MNHYAPNCTAADIREGDLIDVEPIPYYSREDRDMAQFELFEVESVDRETEDCIVIYSDQGSAGMPPTTPIYRAPRDSNEAHVQVANNDKRS